MANVENVEVEHVCAGLVNHHALISLPNFAETTFDKPACSIVTPYMTSAISIVRLLWVIITNCVCWAYGPDELGKAEHVRFVERGINFV